MTVGDSAHDCGEVACRCDGDAVRIYIDAHIAESIYIIVSNSQLNGRILYEFKQFQVFVTRGQLSFLGASRLGKYVASGRIYRLWTSLPYYIYNIYIAIVKIN